MAHPKDHSLQLSPASATDYRELARRRLPRQLFDYIDGGAYGELTMRENVSALERIRLRQRVLQDVSSVALNTRVLDEPLSMPVVLAPVGLGGMFARRAEVQAAQAAADMGVRFCESTVSICSLEEVRGATDAPLWFQLYVLRDRTYTEELMARARAAKYTALLLTVDVAVAGARYRDARNGVAVPLKLPAQLRRAWDLLSHPGWVWDVGLRGRPHSFGNLEAAVPAARSASDFRTWIAGQFDPSLTWEDIAWVRDHWPGKLLVKGVLDAEDARRALATGVDGLVVSNHGGRQLDAVLPTAKALPRIVEAVDGRMCVLVDGGVRSGLDVVKLLALGADACLLGRAWAYAVAAGGRAGVRHLLQILRDELHVAMVLTGHTSIASIGPNALEREHPREPSSN